jgi:enoyl-CoA hydratase/carnithine racemase
MAIPAQFMVEEVSPSYWRVTFENGPVNLVDADSIEQLAHLVSRIEDSPALTVVVFDSANPEYFMAHWDLRADKARVAAMAPGPTGLHPYLDNLVRLSKVPAVTISAIRGRARGAGSEFVLATDIRFAGDQAILGHPEVGLGAVPGGRPMARLARLVGRGRAAEILLGADDIPAELAERYGYVNRVLPDAGPGSPAPRSPLRCTSAREPSNGTCARSSPSSGSAPGGSCGGFPLPTRRACDPPVAVRKWYITCSAQGEAFDGPEFLVDFHFGRAAVG